MQGRRRVLLDNTSGGGGDPTQCLTFRVTSGSLSFNLAQKSGRCYYSTNGGSSWTTMYSSPTPAITEGQTVMWKGNLTPRSAYGIGRFVINGTGTFDAEGNPMSLLYGDNFIGQTSLSGKDHAFYRLFISCTKLVSAENLVLPATTLVTHCYGNMFRGCTNLTTIPELPSTTLANNCYDGMFDNCTSLTIAPELPATTLAQRCYNDMFNNCTSLTIAPELPATTLAMGCYEDMFYNCLNLTTAPELPATTLAEECYSYMFCGCTSLTIAPELPVTTLAEKCYYRMFEGCVSLTTAPELPATTLADYCYYYMFDGCTNLTTAPELPSTTLANNCYNGMFYGTYMLPDCTNINFSSPTIVQRGGLAGLFAGTNITTSQLDTILRSHGITNYSLPVTTLADYCYEDMFYNCLNLTTAPSLPATTLANNCYSRMFARCYSLTTAPVLPATTLAEECYYYMFEDCRSLNYIKCLATNISADNCTSGWTDGVSSSGTFVKASSMTSWTTGTSGIPDGWTVQNV